MTALSRYVQNRMHALDLNYEEVSARTATWDRGMRGKGTGLDADTVRRIVRGERRSIHERTLHLLALALEVPPVELRAAAEDRSRDQVSEFRPPPEAHGPLITPRLQNAWTEIIRASAEAVETARQTGWDAGYAEGLRAQAGGAVSSDPDSLRV
jgi:hypothetical protein